jgi:cullin 1
MRLVEHQRNGDTIDQGLVKKVVDSFVSLGLDESDTNKACLDVYREHFEIPFIDATEKYYMKESESFLAESSVSDYLKKAEERLREEEDRVERYLNKQTRKALISKCEHVLIREHSELMWESFQSLLDFDKDEDLQRMYSLLSRIPEGLEPLRKKFEEHVKKAGLSAVSKLVGEGGANVDALDPKAYVDALLEVHRKNSETVTRSFRGEAGFVASLDKACREFVNRNAATGTSSTKSPELLAKHADMLLRKNNKMAEEGDLEGALNRVVWYTPSGGCDNFTYSAITDGAVQVHRGQGRVPDVLHNQTFQAPHPWCLHVRRERGKHDIEIEGGMWFRIY